MLTDDLMTARVREALAEDVRDGDATTLALVPAACRTTGRILAREACTVAGIPVACEVFRQVDPELDLSVEIQDGKTASAGDTLLRMSGRARGMLTAERTALNFLQRMSGIATLTAAFVQHVATGGPQILDTRKTTPGLRAFEKYSVRCGGGRNHRFGLYDRVMIKDNHRALAGGAGLALDDAVRVARERFPSLEIEVEVESLAELQEALRAAPEWILLDNMTPEQMRECVAANAGRSRLEASGGISLETIDAVAATGVDAVSLGCLTHSARAIDLSLELEIGGSE